MEKHGLKKSGEFNCLDQLMKRNVLVKGVGEARHIRQNKEYHVI